jgi:Eukaryotic aspartyl protease.
MPFFMYCQDGGDTLPDVHLYLGGRPFTLHASDYMMFGHYIAISATNADVAPNDDLIVLGDVFLRPVYTIFDQDRERVGFSSVRRDKDTRLPANSGIKPTTATTVMDAKARQAFADEIDRLRAQELDAIFSWCVFFIIGVVVVACMCRCKLWAHRGTGTALSKTRATTDYGTLPPTPNNALVAPTHYNS